MDLLGLLYFIIVLGIVGYIIVLIIDHVPMLEPFKSVARTIVFLILLLILLRAFWPFLSHALSI